MFHLTSSLFFKPFRASGADYMKRVDPVLARFQPGSSSLFIKSQFVLNFYNCRVEFKNRCPFKRANTEPATGQPASYNQPLKLLIKGVPLIKQHRLFHLFIFHLHVYAFFLTSLSTERFHFLFQSENLKFY